MKAKMVFIFFCLFIANLGFSQTALFKSVRAQKFLFGSGIYPGAKDKEVYLLSISDDGRCVYLGDGEIHHYYGLNEQKNYFDAITWQSKRLGEIAYDTSGVVLVGFKPVFVSEKDYMKIAKKIPTK